MKLHFERLKKQWHAVRQRASKERFLYYNISGRQLSLLILLVISVVGIGILGVQQWAIAVASSPRSLPIYSVETENQEKKIALGINCAWGSSDLPAVLDALDDAGVKATFFLVGTFVDRYPESVQEIAARGHELGNHSDTHADLTTLDEAGIEAEISGCSDKIEALTGTRPTLFRCPSGAYNNRAVNTAWDLGYEVIQWSVDSLDWKNLTLPEMEARILPNLTYGDILLFHSGTTYTAAALPRLLAEIQAMGYTFVPVGELIYPGSRNIDVTGRQFSDS